jgi:hypothetical protein
MAANSVVGMTVGVFATEPGAEWRMYLYCCVDAMRHAGDQWRTTL